MREREPDAWAVQREPPFFFLKAGDAAVGHAPGEVGAQASGGASRPLRVAYPPGTAELHYEVELVVALAQGGRDIAEEKALSKVFGYAVGIDLTRRDLQDHAKEKRRPWTAAKFFDGAAP
jgi:fumarylpyruvate hydrolase|eukprot:COSAG01_NODE_4217_length_5230_cov_15.531280_10_plen_120_part_00